MRKGHTKFLGYSWKLCPFSSAYQSLYTDQGWEGNSHYHDLDHAAGIATEHTTTSGTMIMRTRGGIPGWACADPACGFFNTYDRQYFEV